MKLVEHLSERHLCMGLYSGIYPDEEEGVVTFLLWNLSGQLVGYQQYRPNAAKKARNHPREGRYFTFLGGDQNNKKTGVWGLESLSFRSDALVACEGIFDACRFHNFGIPAVAVLFNDMKHPYEFLFCTGRKLYVASDDHATRNRGLESLHPPSNVVDFGDCSNEQIKNVLEEEGLL